MMARLIDADRIEYIDGHLIINEYLQDEYDGEFVDKYSIDNLPTIDSVPVVRCENCQFWDNEHISSEGLAKCITGESGIRYRRSYDFCSRGATQGGCAE
ncbi:MAG: hypothetical protein KBT27_09840 [Prevotellaceae bacterium]|nr:hypothetical protein [Candidatus Faecinaster equi]